LVRVIDMLERKTKEYDISRISSEGIDRLIELIPFFEDHKSDFGTFGSIEDDVIVMQGCDLSKKAWKFWRVCHDAGLIQDFDWPSWQSEAKKLVADEKKLAQADMEAVGKLITTHIRKDRFCDGHLLSVMESGHIAKILRRLRELREEVT